MSKPMIRIFDTQTNELIDREMNDDEFKLWKIANEQQENDLNKRVADRAALISKLESLGLTLDDLKVLGL